MGNEPPVLPLPGAASGRPLLVSDFDGTITRHDFYQLILDRLPPGSPDYWGEYRAGRMTSFEVLRAIFGAARWGEAELLGLIDAAEPDSNLAESVRKLRAAGWDLVIVSNGCDWYIRRLLAREGLSVEVLANPGRFEPGNGLVMTAPEGSRFFAPAVGIRKGLVVREALD
ncbi:MAG TPA: haloacid dehalogenase-like hydrolase, partial [Gemmataceae bacterium]